MLCARIREYVSHVEGQGFKPRRVSDPARHLDVPPAKTRALEEADARCNIILGTPFAQSKALVQFRLDGRICLAEDEL